MNVLNLWLTGVTRKEIAMLNNISTGNVSNIIREFLNNEVPDIDLLRETSVKIKNSGFQINNFSSVLRLRNMLNLLEIPEETLEQFLVELSVFNYKRDIDNSEEFILKVIKVAEHVKLLDVSVFDIVNEIDELTIKLRDLESKRDGLQTEIDALVTKKNKIITEIEKREAKDPQIPIEITEL